VDGDLRGSVVFLSWIAMENPLLHFVCAVCFALRACARSEKDCSCVSVFILAILLRQRNPVAACSVSIVSVTGSNRSRVLVLISPWSTR
jgi:hypothetical protein